MSNAMISIASITNAVGVAVAAFVTETSTEWWLVGIALSLVAIGVRFGGWERPAAAVAALALFVPSFAQVWEIDARLAGVVLALAGIVHSFMTASRATVVLGGYLLAVFAVFAASSSRSPRPGYEFMTLVVLVGVVGAVATLGITYRSNWQRTARRFRETVRLAPVGIVQYDVAGLDGLIAELQAEGVDDLRSHVAARPELVERAARMLTMVAANPEARTVVGTVDGGRRLRRTGWGEHGEVAVHLLTAAFSGRSEFEFEIGVRTASGRVADLYARGVLLRDGGAGTPARAIVTTVDLGSQKEAERALAAQIEARDRFLASVSHELRTPLSVVLGLTQELADRWADLPDDDRSSLLEMAASQSREMAHLIEDLLVATRIDQANQHVVREPVELRGVVDEVVSVLPNEPVEVTVPDGLTALADTLRVRQVLRNLLANAAAYGGPKVLVRAFADDGWVIVEVADDGPQIASDTEARMFDPYVSGKQPHGRTDSVGLGLHVSRELATLMGGALRYRRIGGMTVFSLVLPVFEQPVAPPVPGPIDANLA